MTPRVQILLARQHQRIREGIRPVKCPKVAGQISLAEYPQIDDRWEEARRKAQNMDYVNFWGKGHHGHIPQIKEHHVKKQEWSLSAIVALGRQTLIASLP